MDADVVIIGGSAAGIVAAVTGKANYPGKDFILVREGDKVVVPCGIPYIFGSLGSSEKNMISDGVITNAGIALKVGRVVEIDRENKICKMDNGTEIGFDKLVLATGSVPRVPKWLKGADLENVFTIPKSKEYLDEMMKKLEQCNKVVTIGGGFIGVEFSDELNKKGNKLTIVEILPHVLGIAFDEEIASVAEEKLKSRGINMITGVGVKEILGDKKVESVLLENGERLEADAVVLSMGYMPNSSLAKDSGIEVNEKGFIKVDEYMRTANPDIFAVGDCAEKRDFITRKVSAVMLASTACAEARTAGMNLYRLSTVKTFGGTIAIFSTAIGDTGFGAAGLTEKTARKEGFDIVTGSFEGIDKHPGTMPDVHRQLVKLIAARESGVIIGGEVVGGHSTGEITNLMGFAIQNKMTVNDILTAQIGTHPMLTAPPTAYPFIKAAEVVARKMNPV